MPNVHQRVAGLTTLWAVFVFFILLSAAFLTFHHAFDTTLDDAAGSPYLLTFGPAAGIVGASLLVLDLILPVPGASVTATLGQLYGGLIGGVYAAVGWIGAGLLGYGGTRLLGLRMAHLISTPETREGLRTFFAHRGGLAIAVTRMVPVVAEVMFCLAGLAPMPFGRFLVALVCGSLPPAFLFATLGSVGRERPITTILIASAVPWFAYPIAHLLLFAGRAEAVDAPTKTGAQSYQGT